MYLGLMALNNPDRIHLVLGAFRAAFLFAILAIHVDFGFGNNLKPTGKDTP